MFKDTPNRFAKYEKELKMICVEEHGMTWDEKPKIDEYGKEEIIDTVELRHDATQIFLSRKLNQLKAHKSLFFLLNEFIERDWHRVSDSYRCYWLKQFSNSCQDFSYEDVLNLVQAHKQFNETEEQKQKRERSERWKVEKEREANKKIQESFGYMFRKYLDKKVINAANKYPSIFKTFVRDDRTFGEGQDVSMFRSNNDLNADYLMKSLDEGTHFLQIYQPDEPVRDFEENIELLIKDKHSLNDYLDKAYEQLLTDCSEKNISLQDLDSLENIKNLDLFSKWASFCNSAYEFYKNTNEDEEFFSARWTQIAYQAGPDTDWAAVYDQSEIDMFEKMISGVEVLREISRWQPFPESFNILCSLYKQFEDDESWIAFWNYALDLNVHENELRPAAFAEQILYKELLTTRNIFATNWDEYRWLDIIEGFEDSNEENFDTYIKNTHFTFLKN